MPPRSIVPRRSPIRRSAPPATRSWTCDAVLDLRAAPLASRPRRQLLCSTGPRRTCCSPSCPNWGTLDRKQLAALVGVAPVVQQRGTRRHEAPIAGGRTRVRTGLWLPTMTAMRHTPVIRPLAGRLRTAGKAHQVIVIACMHKLLTLLNAMVARGEAWAPRDAPA